MLEQYEFPPGFVEVVEEIVDEDTGAITEKRYEKLERLECWDMNKMLRGKAAMDVGRRWGYELENLRSQLTIAFNSFSKVILIVKLIWNFLFEHQGGNKILKSRYLLNAFHISFLPLL